MKTHFKKLMNPDFIGSWDLLDNEGNQTDLVVTITGVETREVKNQDGKTDEVMVLKLKNQKPLICNSTNAQTIIAVTGSPFVEDWSGKSVSLYVAKVRAFGSVHDAIRIRPTAPVVTLPEMTPTNPKWPSAKKAIADGNFTVADVRKKWTLSKENEILITKK